MTLHRIIPGMLVTLNRAFSPFVFVHQLSLLGDHIRFYTSDVAIVIGGEMDDPVTTIGKQTVVPIMICGNVPQIGYINVEIICSTDEIKSEQPLTKIL